MSASPATDAELADLLMYHIDFPCEVRLDSGQVVNIRSTYIREGKRMLTTMKDRAAIARLQWKIDQYPDS